MDINVKKLTQTATLPTRGSAYAAGYDLYADSVPALGVPDKGWTVQINPGDTLKVGTGIALAIPEGYFGGVYPRSGLAAKQGLAPANKVGIIDADYRGEVLVALHNHSNIPQYIHQGDRIAQLIVQPYMSFIWNEVNELDDTERGADGFGSSGK